MTLDDITHALLASYENDGGINHFDGTNLPSEESVNQLCSEFMHLLFPGFFEQKPLTKQSVAGVTARRIAHIHSHLVAELEKSLRFSKSAEPAKKAEELAMDLLRALPTLRQVVRTDVAAPTMAIRPPGASRRSSSPTPACWSFPCNGLPTSCTKKEWRCSPG
jgi:serine O-acetyltransferase